MSINIHPNLKLLSHSSDVTLHRCPRKFELYKLKEGKDESDQHLAFGTCVGIGVQLLLTGSTLDQAIWQMFLAWELDYLDESGLRDKKTFPYCIAALEKFLPYLASLKKKYEVFSVDGKPATELSFRILLSNGFSYRGYVDVVLRDLESGDLVVLELKTTKFSKVHPAIYKHSGQALGYSLVLDAIGTNMQSKGAYKVLYYVYKTGSMEWEPMPFDKSYLQRALWIKQLMMDQFEIEYFAQEGIFPMRGESCYDFFKPCQYFGLCEMSNTHLLPAVIPEIVDKKYQFNFSLAELIESQLAAHDASNASIQQLGI